MSVCLCNDLNEAMVLEAIAAGADSVTRIFQQLDCAASCGKCTPYIRALLRRELPVGDPSAKSTN